MHDPLACKSLGIDDGNVLILAHTGSRAFGPKILEAFGNESGYALTDARAQAYLRLHDQALLWARRNRALAVARILGALGFVPRLEPLIDCVHNFMELRGDTVIHRKGAVSTLNGPVVIPGSRGTLSYIVKPNPATEHTAFSLSHGAGRKWARTECRGRIGKRYDRNSIRRTALKSRVVCRDVDLLFEEAPEAYKNITSVMQALVDHGLAEVVATLRPLLTYKG
jgi:release factor H-coupled RctB family protein